MGGDGARQGEEGAEEEGTLPHRGTAGVFAFDAVRPSGGGAVGSVPGPRWLRGSTVGRRAFDRLSREGTSAMAGSAEWA